MQTESQHIPCLETKVDIPENMSSMKAKLTRMISLALTSVPEVLTVITDWSRSGEVKEVTEVEEPLFLKSKLMPSGGEVREVGDALPLESVHESPVAEDWKGTREM